MPESTKAESTPQPQERKLTQTQVKILYWLDTHRKFRGSKVQLRKQLGYSSDGSLSPLLNSLISGGYVKEDINEAGSSFPLTKRGYNKIFFLRLPDRLLFVIGAVGIPQIYVGLENIFGGIALSPLTPLVGGASMLVIFLTVRILRSSIANDFLDIREPLEESESTPRSDREPDSVS